MTPQDCTYTAEGYLACPTKTELPNASKAGVSPCAMPLFHRDAAGPYRGFCVKDTPPNTIDVDWGVGDFYRGFDGRVPVAPCSQPSFTRQVDGPYHGYCAKIDDSQVVIDWGAGQQQQ